jgi:tRNA (guanine37-N1)-methyltransferase
VALVVQAPGIRVPRSEAETTRRRLLELDVLRLDLAVAKDGDFIVFPVVDTCGPHLNTAPHDFSARALRPAGYQDLLEWPAAEVAKAPRAFDQIGDIIVVKVPPDLMDRAEDIGTALLQFHKARAVFHDRGVKDPYRVRSLERIAGSGNPLTQVAENNIRLWVDLSRAYFSPRLATERLREVQQIKPAEHVVDLFAGVAPFGIQAALKGAEVDCVDLNPDAMVLARQNVEDAKMTNRVHLHTGDARVIAPTLRPADRIAMNLPHGAHAFLDVAARLAKPQATIHYHEILATAEIAKRGQAVVTELRSHGWPCKLVLQRVVRNYSPTEAHVAFDLVGAP